jgi:hypothetical protein
MLRSPAFRALSLTGHRILACIECEYCLHGGKDNGKLPVTHQNFQRFGIHHHCIGPGLRETQALGFIEITQRGLAGNADHRRPNLFRVTYLHTDDGNPPTDEWRKVAKEEAESIADKARTSKPTGYPRLRRKQTNSQCRKTPKPMPETSIGKPPFSMPETGSEEEKSPMPETGSTI